MSRSYKKLGNVKDQNGEVKKIYNRRLRREEITEDTDTSKGNRYRKKNNPWNISDWSFCFYSFEDFYKHSMNMFSHWVQMGYMNEIPSKKELWKQFKKEYLSK